MASRITSFAQAFWADEFARLLLLLALFAGFYSFAFMDVAAPTRLAGTDTLTTVHFFYLSTCPHCRQQIDTNNRLAAQYPQAQWIYHDMSRPDTQELCAQMVANCNATPIKATPVTIIGSRVFVGFDPQKQPEQMRAAIQEALGNSSAASAPAVASGSAPKAIELPLIGTLHPEKMDPLVRSLSLGFVDGFNPCAVWGVIALICMFMLANDWKKTALLVGAFVLFCAIAHFAFVGGFASPYLVMGWMKYVMTLMGVCALFIGIYQIRSAWMQRKKKQVPVESTFASLLRNPLIQGLLVGLVLMAVLFNALGSICAAGVPTLYNQTMAQDGIEGMARLGYLAIYNVAYMGLDLLMLTAVLLLMSGRMGRPAALATQIICALLLTAFGAMLLFAPALLVGG